MSILAPAWAWIAGAIDGLGDSHLPPGIHVRCLPSPRLGVPATPLMVTRTIISASILEQMAHGEGVTWIDSHGNTLSLPFTVTPDNPVYGYFSEPDVIWARLQVRPVTAPTSAPTTAPTTAPTHAPTTAPTTGPTTAPTSAPTTFPTTAPTISPTLSPTFSPTRSPTLPPTLAPTPRPTIGPIPRPTLSPTLSPTLMPTLRPPIPPIGPGPVPRVVAEATGGAASTSTAIHAAGNIAANVAANITGNLANTTIAPGVLAGAVAAQGEGLVFEALADTEHGPTVIQSTNRDPYALCHWFIPRVRVRGSGYVTGIRWIDATAVQRHGEGRLWEWWSLPVKPAPRYTPPDDAINEAGHRVDRSAVLRQPMYVAYTAAGPGAAPAAGGAEAAQRVAQVRPRIDKWLETLLHDTSSPTWDLRDQQAISQAAGSQSGKMGVGIETSLLASSIDPDLGHLLGLGDVDREAKAPPGSLVLYRIRGLFRWNSDAWTKAEAMSFLGALRDGRADALAQFPELEQFKMPPAEDIPYLDLTQCAVAFAGFPPQGMAAPVIASCDDRGWLSTPAPPNVRRALRLLAKGFQPPSLAAVAAHDQYGERTLHAFANGKRMAFGSNAAPPGTPLPWVVSQPDDPSEAGEARMEDRNGAPGAIDYRIARGDWFGRWSGWGKRTAPAKARTAPMRPALLIFPSPPVFAPPPADPPAGLLAGTIEIRIPLPNIAELPAGGAALTGLVLLETFGVNPAASAYYDLASLPSAPGNSAHLEIDPSSAPGHPQQLLIITRTGPALYPAQQIKVSYTARWRDVLNHESLDAYPANKTITDPRPPEAPVIIRPLAYTSRPDAMGHARAEFSFNGAAGVGYRVYTSTESTLLKALDGIDSGLAGVIRSLALINDRAGALVDHKHLFGWDHFEMITPQPLHAGGDGKVHFTHRVSAGLNVAVFYRVVAEGPGGGLSELSKSSMFAFGVPNVGGPGQPLVAVVNVPDKNPVEHGVTLRVRVPHGASAPKAWRLRRTSTAGADPLRMPTVLSGVLQPADLESNDEGHRFDIVAPQPLKPWVNYRFVVEVQGESPPGADPVLVAGEWGDASGPVKLASVPKGAPPPVQQVAVSKAGGGMAITVTPPPAQTLQGTMMGNFQFDAWRIEQGGKPRKLDLPFSYDPVAQTWQAFDAQAVPPGAITRVSVRVIDPLGRSGDATLSNLV